tara:strand:- start:3525 stop:4592 length:1068 start_codon:yes stop_codon:yes gene_type:complete
MLGNLLLTFGANYFKGKARKEKEKRDLAEKKLEEKRAMDNAISLFQTKLDIQTQAESEADRLAEEESNTKKFNELKFIFKDDATNMADYYGVDTALQLGQTMQERAINSGKSVKDMYDINRIENVQPNMDTLKGIAEDNRGVRIQTTETFQTAGTPGIDGRIDILQSQLADLSVNTNLQDDPNAISLTKRIKDLNSIKNIGVSGQDLSIADRNKYVTVFKDYVISKIPSLNSAMSFDQASNSMKFTGNEEQQVLMNQVIDEVEKFTSLANGSLKLGNSPDATVMGVFEQLEPFIARINNGNSLSVDNPALADVPDANKSSAVDLMNRYNAESDSKKKEAIKLELEKMGVDLGGLN